MSPAGDPSSGGRILTRSDRSGQRLWWWRHPETLACGVRQHVVAPGTDPERRCLRCRAIIEVPNETARVAAPGEIPRRGQALREAMVLRLIAIERGVHSLLFAVAAFSLAVLSLNLKGLQAAARHLTQVTS